MRPTPRTILLLSVLLCLTTVVLVCPSCVSFTQSTPVTATSAVSTPSTTSTCQWVIQASLLKAKRIASASDLATFLSAADASSVTEEWLEEFTLLIREYRPAQEEFVMHWRELQPPTEARDVWEIELEAAELRLGGLEDILEGYVQGDWDRFDKGVQAAFEEASRIGTQADNAFVEISRTCQRQIGPTE